MPFWESQSQVLMYLVSNMSQVMVTCHSHGQLNIRKGEWALLKHIREVIDGKGKHGVKNHNNVGCFKTR